MLFDYLSQLAALTLLSTRILSHRADFKARDDPVPQQKQGHSYSHGTDECWVINMVCPIKAMNQRLLYPEPQNQRNVSQLVQDLGAIDTTLTTSYIGSGRVNIAKTYDIEATLCVPKDPGGGTSNKTAKRGKLLVLTYGVGFDRSYWDLRSNNDSNSFVKYATDKGYSTLAYDRLGVGGSQKPDPIKEVQAYVDVEILHSVLTQVRSQRLQNWTRTPVTSVIGVGHSYGSIIQLNNNLKYPNDTDASIVTGLSSNLEFLSRSILSTVPTIAAINDPSRFAGLPAGYIVHRDNASIAQPFLHYPGYSEDILNEMTDSKGLYTVGQAFTLAGIFAPAVNYTKPVDVVLGEKDFTFCGGNCAFNGTNSAQSTLAALWPAAEQSSNNAFLVPKSGHLINAQDEAQQGFRHIFDFLDRSL